MDQHEVPVKDKQLWQYGQLISDVGEHHQKLVFPSYKEFDILAKVATMYLNYFTILWACS